MIASELRIGNYITDIWAHKNSYFQVKQIGEKHLWYGLNSSDSFKALNDNIRPIPITEDWLVKFGFKIADEVNGGYLISINYDWQKEYLYCSKRGTIGLWNDEKKQDFIIMNKCEFIHQFQNLYFALTGNELIFKE